MVLLAEPGLPEVHAAKHLVAMCGPSARQMCTDEGSLPAILPMLQALDASRPGFAKCVLQGYFQKCEWPVAWWL